MPAPGPDGDVLAALGEHARRLHDLGLTAEGDRVLAAVSKAREDPQQAAALLREISAGLMAQAPAYGHGMPEVVRRMREDPA